MTDWEKDWVAGSDVGTRMDVMTFITFSAGEVCCGIDILQVQEINKLSEITPVPGAPVYVRGVLNLRGQIVTIIDAAEKLGTAPFSISETNRNIIVRSQNEYVGLFVEKVGDVVQGNADNMEAPPANTGNGIGKYFRGVLKNDGLLIGILDLEEVMR